MRRTTAWLLAMGLVTSYATPSAACLWGPPPRRVDPNKLRIAAAERALAGGEHAKAVRLAKQVAPRLSELRPGAAPRFAARAQRTLALALVRSGGAVAVARGIGGDDAYARQVGLAWAELTLTWHTAMARDNLLFRSQLAEALAGDRYQRGRGHEMLRELASRDLMPTARGYAVLATLEADEGARATALARCREIGGAELCDG